MPVTLNASGVELNGVQISAPPAGLTYKAAEYSTRQSIGTSPTTIWDASSYFLGSTGFTKKSSTSKIIVQGQCIGLDAYSYPYGGTHIRLRHSDGTDYYKHIGSQYTHNGDGAQTVFWKVNCYFTAANLGNKTGNFTVHWGYNNGNGGSGDKPWESVWNFNSSDDGRSRQQGSTTSVIEVE